MLSKILSGESGATATRWSWPTLQGPQASACSAVPEANSNGASDARMEQQIAELEQRAERQVREARQAGFREGESAGRSQAQAQLHPVLERLAESIRAIGALRPQVMREAEADLVQLAIGIARRILHREVSVDPAALEGLVKAALDKLPAQEISRVRTHPELESKIRQALDKAGRGGLPVTADGTLEPGAVYIETGRGKLDASLETQLSEIGRGLADRIGGD